MTERVRLKEQKRKGGHTYRYYYLVRSEWGGGNPTERVLKYLGKEVPAKYAHLMRKGALSRPTSGRKRSPPSKTQMS